MGLLTWKPEYSVNVKEIDSQHRKIFSLINDLENGTSNGLNVAIIERTFAAMTEYSSTHFQIEEKYFKLYSYADSAEHNQKHREFEQRLEEFKHVLAQDQDANFYLRFLSTEVVKFLEHWWMEHIRVSDKKYSQCFNEHGLV
jgi:hemerythrin-like metal-binding domain